MTVTARVRKVSFTVRVLTATYWPLVLTVSLMSYVLNADSGR